MIFGFVVLPAIALLGMTAYFIKQFSFVRKLTIYKITKLTWAFCLLAVLSMVILTSVIFLAVFGSPCVGGGGGCGFEILAVPFLLIPAVIVTAIFFATKKLLGKHLNSTPNAYGYLVAWTSFLLSLGIIAGLAMYAYMAAHMYIYGYNQIKEFEEKDDAIFFIESFKADEFRPESSGRNVSDTANYRTVPAIRTWGRADYFPPLSYSGELPQIVLYHNDYLYTLFTNTSSSSLNVRLAGKRNDLGEWFVSPTEGEILRGDLVVQGRHVYYFEFISESCEFEIYDNCQGNLHKLKRNGVMTLVDEVVDYSDFKSDSRTIHQYLVIKNRSLVPGDATPPELYEDFRGNIASILTPITIYKKGSSNNVEETVNKQEGDSEVNLYQQLGSEAGYGEAVIAEVVSGDTARIFTYATTTRTVRFIGIEAPKKDSLASAECFSEEATARAVELLAGQTVLMAFGPMQNLTDENNHLLQYATLPDGREFGETMIAEGFAYEYSNDKPYLLQSRYQAAEQAAKAAGKGLWAECELASY